MIFKLLAGRKISRHNFW